MRLKIGNFKGPQGEQGKTGKKGDTGETGQRGSRWASGTAITGTSTIGTKFPGSGITDALVHDCYVNVTTGNIYECTVSGTADVAEWVHIGNIKGPTGATGPAGSISDINNQKPTYSEASKLENIASGEAVNVAFGKLKKAISVLITHYTQKATQSILGHVKLSNSAAITTLGEYALDAIEKNATIDGTLAHMLAQVNSNSAKKNAANTFTQQQRINANMAVEDNSYNKAPFVINADAQNNSGYRAQIGFHNAGVNGAAFYLDVDSKFKAHFNSGKTEEFAYQSDLAWKVGNYNIDTLTSFDQIDCTGFWKIGSIDDNYAQSIGITNNPGDYTALVIQCNRTGGVFQYGNLLLFSPRLGVCFYSIQLWENSLGVKFFGS